MGNLNLSKRKLSFPAIFLENRSSCCCCVIVKNKIIQIFGEIGALSHVAVSCILQCPSASR